MMTNYEAFIKSMTQDKLISIMLFVCDECPVENCEYRNESVSGFDCSEKLEQWFETVM